MMALAPEFIGANTLGYLILGSALFFVMKWTFDSLSSATRKTKNLPLPPGPKPKFLIGNALDFPITDAARHFLDLGKICNSDMVHMNALGNHILCLNKREMAEELLEKRAKNYSGRPVIPIVELMGWEWNMPLHDHGEGWQRHRRVCQQLFNRRQSKTYEPIQLRWVHKMLYRLLESPEQWHSHNTVLSVAITMDMMFGQGVDSLDDPAIAAASKNLEIGSPILMPGASLMNIFPILRHIPAWVPGNTARKLAEETKYWSREMQRIPMEDVKRRMREGIAKPSIIVDFLERKQAGGASDEEESVINNVAHSVFGAASDTTVSASGTFFHIMSINPEIQKKAQAEIDRVVGTQRLPTLADRASLPYVEAIYREVMRYSPPLRIGLGHKASEDDYYEGYFIPKGTVVFGNIWAMTHDETIYREPLKFNPDRFLNEKGELNDDSRVLAYGFGRRICVGKYVASATMWLTIVSVLACFTIGKEKDEFGNDIPINDDYEDRGFIVYKEPFKCSITPRSDQAQRLIEEAVSEGK